MRSGGATLTLPTLRVGPLPLPRCGRGAVSTMPALAPSASGGLLMGLALTGARLFDGERIQDGQSVVIEGERIAAIVPDGQLGPALPRQRLKGLLAPGFVDVQVNGGGGVLFNDQPTV